MKLILKALLQIIKNQRKMMEKIKYIEEAVELLVEIKTKEIEGVEEYD